MYINNRSFARAHIYIITRRTCAARQIAAADVKVADKSRETRYKEHSKLRKACYSPAIERICLMRVYVCIILNAC